MGEEELFQPLTKWDKATVLFYRAGIFLSTVIIAISAYMLIAQSKEDSGVFFNILLGLLYISIGLSVFFIHLYVSKFKRRLKNLYYLSVAMLIVLFIISRGDVLGLLENKPYMAVLLIPVSGCLGFITAKEAFCFKLWEGYVLALIMPLYILMLSAGIHKPAPYGLLLIAVLLLFFTFRKVFMPLHYDIGDKTAYQ